MAKSATVAGGAQPKAAVVEDTNLANNEQEEENAN